jgi:hypothetical protein
MKWILRDPSHSLGEFSDSFMVDRFHLCLGGNNLEVKSEEEENDALVAAARTLAERYIAILQKHIPIPLGPLMTVDEFVSLPAWGSMIVVRGKTHTERERFRYGLREARHEMLTSSDPYLFRCYDYLEDAREDETSYFVPLYKFVETVKQALGAEVRKRGGRKMKEPVKQLLKELGVEEPVEALKRFCNDKQVDARHAPTAGEAVKPLSAEDRSRAISCAYKILAAYEKHLHSKASDSGTAV